MSANDSLTFDLARRKRSERVGRLLAILEVLVAFVAMHLCYRAI